MPTKTKKKKVLIIYATGGMGHVTAARALEQSFAKHHKNIEIRSEDVIDYAAKAYKKIFVDGYNFVSARQPELWGWLYKKFNDRTQQKIPMQISRLAIESRFTAMIEEFEPDHIVVTHPLPAILMSYAREKQIAFIPLSIVVTDYGCHSFWVDPIIDNYFVATNDVGKCLEQFGVRQKNVTVTGIPIEQKFTKKLNKSTVRKKLKLDAKDFVMMIVGGQLTFTQMKKVITGIHKQAPAVKFLVVAGRDKKLKMSIERSKLHADQRISTFGFVSNMEELMAASDVIFSKAGGLTTSECLAMGLPMIIFKVIPGQEEANVEFLINHKAALKADSLNDIVTHAVDLASGSRKISQMTKAVAKIAKPQSAKSVTDHIVRSL